MLLLQTQDSVPSLEEHMTMRRSRVLLGKQLPDRSCDQVTLLVQTQTHDDACRIHKAKIGNKPSLAKGKVWKVSHEHSMDSHGHERIPMEHPVAL